MTYNPITGEFYRDGVRVSPCIRADGYALIRYAGKQWKAHRLAFHLLGVPIPAMVDHANRDRAANQWYNLREATASQNGRNSVTRRTGLKGAYPKKGRWQAAIRIDFKYHHLGTFATEQEAHDKYCSVARQVAGELACL